MSGLFSLESWSTVWTHRESFLLGLGNTLQTAVCALALAFIKCRSAKIHPSGMPPAQIRRFGSF